MIILPQLNLRIAYLIRQSIDIIRTNHKRIRHLMQRTLEIRIRPRNLLLDRRKRRYRRTARSLEQGKIIRLVPPPPVTMDRHPLPIRFAPLQGIPRSALQDRHGFRPLLVPRAVFPSVSAGGAGDDAAGGAARGIVLVLARPGGFVVGGIVDGLGAQGGFVLVGRGVVVGAGVVVVRGGGAGAGVVVLFRGVGDDGSSPGEGGGADGGRSRPIQTWFLLLGRIRICGGRGTRFAASSIPLHFFWIGMADVLAPCLGVIELLDSSGGCQGGSIGVLVRPLVGVVPAPQSTGGGVDLMWLPLVVLFRLLLLLAVVHLVLEQ
mmetsp:Transcript_34909/g.62840  ORF Transcript_34909/g.62840 Transcript_34909/m.62840 type:complete len:319 (+) Transcript_34909:427-1383(+)